MNAVLNVHPGATQLDAAASAIDLARESGSPALLSHAELLPYAPDPLALLAQASASLEQGILWARPESRVVLAGAGAAVTIRADGPGRFADVAAAMRQLRGRVVSSGVDARLPLIGGFAFAPRDETPALWQAFPDALLVAPAVLLQIEGQRAIARVTLDVAPGARVEEVARRLHDLLDYARSWASAPLMMPTGTSAVSYRSIPERPVWESSVATAVAMIRTGLLDKIVLAREERLLADSPYSPVDALVRLRQRDPAAALFALQAGASWFIGASPERLVRLENGRVDVTCLAGSIGMGESIAEREALARQLLTSDKDRREHEIVVRSTMRALAEVCDAVYRLPGTPRVVPARSVQHLETPLHGRLSRAGTVLDLVERLHPTPAVGGHPRDAALSRLRELEAIERGWYAGPIGWTDLDGAGEFVVAIRSALLTGSSASLFAGCGIVAGSVPEAEYEETNLKLRPMIAALGAA